MNFCKGVNKLALICIATGYLKLYNNLGKTSDGLLKF